MIILNKSSKLIFVFSIIMLISLSFVVGYQGYKIKKNLSILRSEVFRMNNALSNNEYYYDRLYSQARRNDFEFELEIDNLDVDKLSDIEKNKLEKKCQFELDESPDKTVLAKAYHCVSSIQAAQKSFKDHYQAIKNISYGLDLVYSKKRAKHLAILLLREHQEQIEEIVGGLTEEKLLSYFDGTKEHEIEFLNKLLALNISELSAKIYSRLAMINYLGRASSLEEVKLDLQGAINAQHMVIKFAGIKQDNAMDVVLVINEAYAPHAATTIASALVSSNLDTIYNFHFVIDPNDKLSEESKKKLASMRHIRNYNIHFHELDLNIIPVDLIKKRFINCTWPLLISFRPFLPDILPNLKQALSLDADLLVLRDLSYFKTLDMDGYLIAGAYDLGIPSGLHSIECKQHIPYMYINAGVMWISLEEMRKQNVSEQIKANLETTKCKLPYFEQDIINITLVDDKIKVLSYKWNTWLSHPLLNFNHHKYILHYLGKKPWSFKRDETPKEYQEYWFYRDLTPWPA